jgi:hypothetical protein
MVSFVVRSTPSPESTKTTSSPAKLRSRPPPISPRALLADYPKERSVARRSFCSCNQIICTKVIRRKIDLSRIMRVGTNKVKGLRAFPVSAQCPEAVPTSVRVEQAKLESFPPPDQEEVRPIRGPPAHGPFTIVR